MEWILYALGAPLGIWFISRLIFVAYFKTKQQFNKEDRNGQRTQPGP